MNSDYYFPERLVKARKFIGNQKTAAKTIGYSQGQLLRAEKGTSASYELLFAVASEAKVDIRTILRPNSEILNIIDI